MAVAYSFHLSGKGHSVSSTGKVSQVSRHNLRLYKSADYDKSQIEILRGSDTSVLSSIKEIYHAEFDDALDKYNSGKREDRKIQDYLKHISDSRSDVAAEIIIQIGDKEFWEGKSDSERKQMSYIFKDQLRSLEKLVPEFKVASAVVHYDESSPHMHVVGVPVAEGYKKGLEKQVAKTKVFTAERLSFLQDEMRARAEKGMSLSSNQNLFDAVELKPKEKGRNKDIPKYQLEEYYALKQETETLKKEKAEVSTDYATIKAEIGDLSDLKESVTELVNAHSFYILRDELGANPYNVIYDMTKAALEYAQELDHKEEIRIKQIPEYCINFMQASRTNPVTIAACEDYYDQSEFLQDWSFKSPVKPKDAISRIRQDLKETPIKFKKALRALGDPLSDLCRKIIDGIERVQNQQAAQKTRTIKKAKEEIEL